MSGLCNVAELGYGMLLKLQLSLDMAKEAS